jgi:hypothetical protein
MGFTVDRSTPLLSSPFAIPMGDAPESCFEFWRSLHVLPAIPVQRGWFCCHHLYASHSSRTRRHEDQRRWGIGFN